MKPLTSVVDLLRCVHYTCSNPQALNVIEGGSWRALSSEKMLANIKKLALGLVALGVTRGERVGILAHPSAHWVIADLAIMVSGAVSVPLFANISVDNFLYEVKNADVKVLFVAGNEQWELYHQHKEQFTTVISFGDDHHGVGATFSEIMHLGTLLDERKPWLYGELEAAVRPDDLATIVYTSGSTGNPKGVEITHEALVSLLAIDDFHLDSAKDRYLSILPLAHIFGRTLNLFMIAWGVSIYYSNDHKNLGLVCREIHPTVIVVVPRLLEKIYAKMLANVQKAGQMKRTLGEWAFVLAHQEEKSLFKTLMHPVADKIVFSVLREALGGSLRLVITGGAHLNPHLCHFFIDIGVPIYEGYGLTEASTVTCNVIGRNKPGTIGKPLEGVEVTLSPDNEILVRGKLVMRGYHNDPDATALALDQNGWLHTGDKGHIDSEGYVSIIGRIKEMYKTSTGEYIAPVPIEQALCKAALIDMAMVIGNDRKFASCLLFPDFDVLHSMKVAQGVENMSDTEFLCCDFVKDEMVNFLRNINSHLNEWERLRAYRFVLVPLTVESGELTPSMKIRREIIEKKYSALIDEIYAE